MRPFLPRFRRAPLAGRGRQTPDVAAGSRAVRALAAVVVAAAALVACGGGGGGSGTTGASVATAERRGSFSVACGYSHSAGDDPIVHAGHGGASHRHDFFGATTTDAGSTASSLMAGGTTCRSVADRSAYWAPALEASGRPVTPTHVQAYYRTPVGADAAEVRPLPNGLEMIAGDAAATAAQDPAVVHWSCGVPGDASPVPRRCGGTGAELRLVLVFPQCWDGERLRSEDHVSHLARLPEGGRRCPASHPVLLPETTVEVRYPTDLPPGDLTLASGPATGGHGDLLVAWDQDHLAAEVGTCLHHNRRCDVTSEPQRLDTLTPSRRRPR